MVRESTLVHAWSLGPYHLQISQCNNSLINSKGEWPVRYEYPEIAVMQRTLPWQPFQNVKEPGEMADPMHTGSGFTESVVHALLKRLIVEEVVTVSKAVFGNHIDSKS